MRIVLGVAVFGVARRGIPPLQQRYAAQLVGSASAASSRSGVVALVSAPDIHCTDAPL